MTVPPLIAGVLARDPRAVARAISLVENEPTRARALIGHLHPHTGHAYPIGVTGGPGVGKSTLVDHLVSTLRERGQTVAVLAVDPTSPYSGGAILGDRVRMQAHASDPGVFIRSMATRGRLGGLARATAGAVTVLDAAGYDVILIETVGVGQDEVDIANTVDLSIVVLVPEGGDEVQAMKAGVMEIGDLFVVNKADHEGADRMVATVEMALSLDAPPEGAWRPPVLPVVATVGTGVGELLDAIARFRAATKDRLGERRRSRAGLRLPEAVELDHVGIAVEDPSTLLAFLQVTLGLTADDSIEIGAQDVRVRFVQAGESSLELIESTAEGSPLANFLRKRGPGLHHVALRVADLDATLASLVARGVRLIDTVPRPGAYATRIAFVHPSSTGGVLIELVEHAVG